MEDMFRIEGTVLWIKVPEELDHHIAEKMNAVANIQAYFYALKSSSSSEEVSFRR